MGEKEKIDGLQRRKKWKAKRGRQGWWSESAERNLVDCDERCNMERLWGKIRNKKEGR